MNKPMLVVIVIFAGLAVLNLIIELLNLKAWSAALPAEFQGYYDPQRYATAQKYLADNTVLLLAKAITVAIFVVLMISLGGFNFVDNAARGLWAGAVGRGLVFAGILFTLFFLLSLPFDIYDTFLIEAKYGFNRTTPRTFIFDTLKMLLLSAVLGGVVLAAILWLFEKCGAFAWVYAWLALALFQILIIYIAPAVIMPLFNRFSPLEDGKLKTEIEQLARRENFRIKGIYVMDGSKRSTKANAALTGFGRLKRIMLYDTLLKQLNENEIVAVLAHEIGHYKFKHIIKFLSLSLALSACAFFVFSRLADRPLLFKAFGAQHISVYAALIYFSLLLAPIQRFGSVFSNWLSRSFEYEADAYTVRATRDSEALISALKKISADSMANLQPHAVKVVFDYSHPPVLQRIGALRRSGAESGKNSVR